MAELNRDSVLCNNCLSSFFTLWCLSHDLLFRCKLSYLTLSGSGAFDYRLWRIFYAIGVLIAWPIPQQSRRSQSNLYCTSGRRIVLCFCSFWPLFDPGRPPGCMLPLQFDFRPSLQHVAESKGLQSHLQAPTLLNLQKDSSARLPRNYQRLAKDFLLSSLLLYPTDNTPAVPPALGIFHYSKRKTFHFHGIWKLSLPTVSLRNNSVLSFHSGLVPRFS